MGLGLGIVSTFSSFYWDLSQRATLYTETQRDLAVAADPDLTKEQLEKSKHWRIRDVDVDFIQYDFCGEPLVTDADPDGTVQFDTNWSLVYRFNAIVYTILTGMVMCSCTGLIYTKIFSATLSCLQIAGLVHIVAIILAAVYRFNDDGKKCAANATEYDLLGNSWESDGALFRKLFIAQCSLLIPFCMCACIGMRTGRQTR